MTLTRQQSGEPMTPEELRELEAAAKVAERYIRKHGPTDGGGGVLTLEQQRAPEWLAIKARLDAALWPPPLDERPGQLDLFGT